jgi:uncharacterized membrane protein YcaP (DUF421 family)
MDGVAELFRIDVPVWETIVRGSAVYLSLFAIFRFVVRRDIGAVGIADLLVLVLVADAAQNAMAGTYTTITDGLILVLTLIFWNVLFDWLAYRFPAFERFMQGPPVLLIQNGRYLRRNMRRELVTVGDLEAKLRGEGIDDVRDVAKATLENDGEITVVPRKRRRAAAAKKR